MKTPTSPYFSILLLAATPAFAGHYDGPPTDVNLVPERPAKYAECDQYLSDPHARRYAACEFARDESERMAERYAGGYGRIDGYLRGYAWSLHKFAKLNSDDAAEIARGEQRVDSLGPHLQAGIDAGRAAGKGQGTSKGTSDAIERFLAVLDKSQEPDPTVVVPPTQYAGEDQAYAKYVGKVPNASEIVRKELQLDPLPVYQSRDAVYLGDVRPLSPWDLIFDDGTYRFEHQKWHEPAAALTQWKRLPVDTRPKYDNLDPSLQAVFDSAFQNSYSWYVSYSYSRNFHDHLELGALAGEQVGTQLGKRIAQYVGLVRAFDRKFKESSEAAFYEAYLDSYGSSFNATFQDYLTHPKLALEFQGIEGEVNDGIIQPGERISARFKITNVGGMNSSLQVSLAGDVRDSGSQAFEIQRLVSREFFAPLLARIDPRINPRDQAHLTLKVNGLHANLDQTVLKMIQLTHGADKVDAVLGAGTVSVSISNVSTVRTPDQVTATLKINGQEAETQQLGFLEPGDTVNAVLTFNGLDPLAIIQGETQAEVITRLGEVTTDQFAVTLSPVDRRLELAKYFNQLVNDRGLVPGGVDREVRAQDVLALIAKINEQEVRAHRNGNNVFRTDPSSLLVGKVLDQFLSQDQPDKARDAYDRLGQAMWGARKQLWQFLFIKGPKRAAYERLVKRLSKTGKYKARR